MRDAEKAGWVLVLVMYPLLGFASAVYVLDWGVFWFWFGVAGVTFVLWLLRWSYIWGTRRGDT